MGIVSGFVVVNWSGGVLSRYYLFCSFFSPSCKLQVFLSKSSNWTMSESGPSEPFGWQWLPLDPDWMMQKSEHSFTWTVTCGHWCGWWWLRWWWRWWCWSLASRLLLLISSVSVPLGVCFFIMFLALIHVFSRWPLHRGRSRFGQSWISPYFGRGALSYVSIFNIASLVPSERYVEVVESWDLTFGEGDNIMGTQHHLLWALY